MTARPKGLKSNRMENNCVMGNLIHREYVNEFKKVGETVTIRKPVRFEVTDGADISNNIQDLTEMSTTFTISSHKNVAWAISQRDMTLKIEDFSERYITPAMVALANNMDAACCGLYKDVFAAAGTAGVTPASFASVAAVARKLDDMAVPRESLRVVTDPAANWSLADALKGSFDRKLAEDTVRKGYLAEIANLQFYTDQNVRNHTAGTATGMQIDSQTGIGTYLTLTDTAESSTVYMDTGTGTLKVGDIFTIAGVYMVNPVSGDTTAHLQQFVVLADKTLTGTDDAVSVYPAIRISGAYKTVNAAPANDALVTLVGSHAANIAFHRNAFGLVTIPFEEVGPGQGVKMVTENCNGLSITVTQYFDGSKFKNVIRLDVLYGTKTLYPELACRMLG